VLAVIADDMKAADRALLLVGWAGALRNSQLVALEFRICDSKKKGSFSASAARRRIEKVSGGTGVLAVAAFVQIGQSRRAEKRQFEFKFSVSRNHKHL